MYLAYWDVYSFPHQQNVKKKKKLCFTDYLMLCARSMKRWLKCSFIVVFDGIESAKESVPTRDMSQFDGINMQTNGSQNVLGADCSSPLFTDGSYISTCSFGRHVPQSFHFCHWKLNDEGYTKDFDVWSQTDLCMIASATRTPTILPTNIPENILTHAHTHVHTCTQV